MKLKILFQDLFSGNFSASEISSALEECYSRGCVDRLPPSESEKCWEKLIVAHKEMVQMEGVEIREVIAAIYYDMSIAPYLGVSFEKRKPFYTWCLMLIENHR